MKQVRIVLNNKEFHADEVSEKQMDRLVDVFIEASRQDMALITSTMAEPDPHCLCHNNDFFDKPDEEDDDDGTSPFDEYFDDGLYDDKEDEPQKEVPDKFQPVKIGEKIYSSADQEDDFHSPFGQALSAAMLQQMDKRGPINRPFKLDPTNLVDPMEEPEINNYYAENQDFFYTGIKYRNLNGRQNVPHYRTRYECPVCEGKGNHYVPEGTPQVSCHECKAQLEVKEATSLGFPNKDEWNNFYVAYDTVEKTK